ncbi:COP9 signalosome [Boletus edulis]|nr:COP9 signalosome [Boletus edulis]
MASRQLATLYRELQRVFDARPTDLKKCGALLDQLKIGLIQTDLLIPTADANLQDLVVARDILEIGTICSIRAKDLQTFYTDFRSVLPPSKREFPVRGLNLIRLLTQNRIADFHTTLESLPLPADEISVNPYIAHPVNLERWLMEGSYSKRRPAEEYKFFVDSLMGTIRNEIASCEESAYERLPLKDAATLLFFTSQSDLLKFAKERGWQVDLTAGLIKFARKNDEQTEIPKQKLIAANLVYARELEQIV